MCFRLEIISLTFSPTARQLPRKLPDSPSCLVSQFFSTASNRSYQVIQTSCTIFEHRLGWNWYFSKNTKVKMRVSYMYILSLICLWRGCYWSWVASNSGIHKHWVLLYCWIACWHTFGIHIWFWSHGKLVILSIQMRFEIWGTIYHSILLYIALVIQFPILNLLRSILCVITGS